MPLRLVEITAPSDNTKKIQEIAEKHDSLDTWHSAKNQDGRRSIKILTTLTEQQDLTDDLQKAMGKEKDWRIVVQAVEATIPRQDNNNGKNGQLVRGAITREELYNEIEKNARTDFNFVLLVFLSTIVCAIGLMKDNIAVIIGAMVIAPLLGPNLALSFGAALGDRHMIIESIKSNIVGLGLTLIISIITGVLIIHAGTSQEMMDRTDVGYEDIALALASGAAAVLSMVSGLSSALVGVMVAVALMPPAVTLGLMISAQNWGMAGGAGLLLATNIVCISIAAQIVFLIRGIKPRTWYRRRKSQQSVYLNLAFWVLLLAAIIGLIYWRHLA